MKSVGNASNTPLMLVHRADANPLLLSVTPLVPATEVSVVNQTIPTLLGCFYDANEGMSVLSVFF